MKKVVAVALVAFVLAMGTTMNAQSPDKQFGIGGVVGGVSAAQIQYAISPAFHLGAFLGLQIQGSTQLVFGPYGKFIFAGSKELKPFVFANLMISSTSTGGTNSVSSTSTGLNFGAGAEYFITPNFGFWAGITVLSLPLSPSGQDVGFGILAPSIGGEWFF